MSRFRFDHKQRIRGSAGPGLGSEFQMQTEVGTRNLRVFACGN